MSLFDEWKKLTESQTDETFKAFWEKYSGTEKRIYSDILDQAAAVSNVPLTDDVNEELVMGTYDKAPKWTFSVNVGEAIKKYDAEPAIFMGFLDGIQESLTEPFDLEAVDENSALVMKIDLAKLFYNMVAAEADYLFRLPQWEDILGIGTMAMLIKKYKKSKTVVNKEKKVGRNDPCPCGSGKKYKYCCGRNA